MSDAVRNVLIKVGLDFSGAQASAASFGAAGEKSADKVTGALAATEKNILKVDKHLEKVAAEADKFGTRAFESSLRAADGFARAGEGLFKLARGIAFVTSDSEAGLREMIESVARVQGAFDLFKGGIDVIEGVSVGYLALTKAAGPAAAATLTVATAHEAAAAGAAAQTAATTGATAALGRLAATAGPIGIAVAGIAAVGGFAYMTMKSDAEKVAEAQRLYNKELEESEDRLEKVAAAERTRHEGAMKLMSDRAAMQLRLIDARANAGKPIDDLIKSAADVGGHAMDRAIADVVFNTPALGFKPEDAKRIVNTNEITARDIMGAQGKGEDKLVALQGVEKALEAEIAGVMKVNDLRERERGLLRDKLSDMEAIRDKAAQAVDEERKRFGIQEEIGRLTEVERAELEQIAELRKQGAQLSTEQLKRAETLAPGLTGQFVGREFAKQGEATTGRIGDAFKVDQTAAEKLLADATRQTQELSNKIAEQGKTAVKGVQDAWEAIMEVLERLAPVQDDINKLRSEIRRRDMEDSAAAGRTR